MDKYKIILKNIDNKNFEEAEKICNKIKDLEKDHIALNLLGLSQIKQNKYNLAEKNFLKSSMINENFEASIENLFLIYLRQKKIPKMLFCAKKLVNLNKNMPDYNYFLALAFELDYAYDDAIKLYEFLFNFLIIFKNTLSLRSYCFPCISCPIFRIIFSKLH